MFELTTDGKMVFIPCDAYPDFVEDISDILADYQDNYWARYADEEFEHRYS